MGLHPTHGQGYQQARGDRLATPIILRLKIGKIKYPGNLFGHAGDVSLGNPCLAGCGFQFAEVNLEKHNGNDYRRHIIMTVAEQLDQMLELTIDRCVQVDP